jgi:integrase
LKPSPDRCRALIVLGAGTGVRISEALGVTNDPGDWMRRTVTIDRQLVRGDGIEPTFGPVKDKKNRPRAALSSSPAGTKTASRSCGPIRRRT